MSDNDALLAQVAALNEEIQALRLAQGAGATVRLGGPPGESLEAEAARAVEAAERAYAKAIEQVAAAEAALAEARNREV